MNALVTNLYPSPALDKDGTPIADQRLVVSNAVVTFSVFDKHTEVIVLDVQTADVMCTFDGSDPSPTNGHRLYAGKDYSWSRARAVAARFIRQSTTDAAIHASESNS